MFSRKNSIYILKLKVLVKTRHDHVEDKDGLILQQPTTNKSFGLMMIVKIKKKACIYLKDLNQLDDYDNFV